MGYSATKIKGKTLRIIHYGKKYFSLLKKSKTTI